MSVVKSKRGISKMEFIENANVLEVYTIRHCAKFPKRYTFTLSNEIVGYSREIYNNVSSANRYPTTIKDYMRRLELFAEAKEYIYKMVRQLRVADEIFGIKSSVLEEWMYLLDKEERLINGVILSDRDMIKYLKSRKDNEKSK